MTNILGYVKEGLLAIPFFGSPQGVVLVGISIDESATNLLVGNQEGTTQWPPESIDRICVCVTPNSTVEYVVHKCLRTQGLNMQNVTIIYGEQADCIAALTPTENGTAKVCELPVASLSIASQVQAFFVRLLTSIHCSNRFMPLLIFSIGLVGGASGT